MRVIGIDPGLANTGYGVIDKLGTSFYLVEAGIIYTLPSTPLASRLLEIFNGLQGVVVRLQPEEMAVEDIHSRSTMVKPAILMAHARGAAIMSAAQSNIAVFHYQPRQAKAIVTGSGRADKRQVQQAVASLVRDSRATKNEHVADAISIALCHAFIADSAARTLQVQ